MFNGLIKKAFALVIILLSVCTPACSENPAKTEDKPQITATKTNEPQKTIKKVEQKAVSLRKYVRGGNRDIVIYDFGDYTEKEIIDALDVLQKPEGFLEMRGDTIIFRGDTLTIDGVPFWKGGPWKKELLHKLVYHKNGLLKNGEEGKHWDELSSSQQYAGKMPVIEVGLVKPPEIKFETNPKTREEVIAKGRILEAYVKQLLQGVDMSKVEGTEEYKDILTSIDELINDESLYVYLQKGSKNQLLSVQYQIENQISDLRNLVNHL